MAETTKGAATPTTDANVLPTLVHQANDLAAALEKYKSLAAKKEDAVYFLNSKGKAAPGYIDSPTDDMTPMNKIFAAIHADRNDYATYQVYRIKTRVPGDIRVDKGEHGMSLTHTLWNYYKAKKGEKVENGKEVITLADYKKLGNEEQAKYVKSPQRQVRNAFNIDQTDVTQRDDYNQIVEKYGNYEDRVDASDRAKDTAKQRMAFNAYIKAVSGNMTRIAKASTTETHYDAKKDVINLAAQSNYATYADYTQDVNRQIISATGNAERRGRRGAISGSNITPSNSDMAREALIVELASAARQLDMGMPANISETNRKYIDTWIETLKANPNYLVDVEREVSIANKIVEDAAAGIKIERKSDKLSSALLARVPENAKTYSEVQVTQREDGRWCIYFGDKENKQYQAATLAAADTTAYFEQLRHFGQRHEKFLDFKQHLAQAYSAKIANDPSVVASNIFYDNVEGADVVEKASLYVKDSKTYISPTIGGKRLQAKEITWPQQHRIIISPDRTAALKGLSALMYQNEVKAQQQANQKAEEEKKQQAVKEAEVKKVREAAEKQKKAEAAKAKSDTMKAAAFYTVVATLTSDYETRAFDRYMQDSEYDRMLEAAETYGKGRDVDLTAVYNSVPVKHGKVVAFGEDGANVVLYQEGVYTVLKAVSEEDIRAALMKNGLPQGATPLVQTISETIKKEQSEKEQAKTAQQTTMSPIMKQYKELKKKHPEALLLFRCGDFYEAYAEDAHNASKILGLTLSQRNGSSSKEAAMTGFPYHALDTYLPRLIRAGQRVAILDSLEVPKQTKKVKTEKQTIVKISKGNTESNAQQQTKVKKQGLTLTPIQSGEFYQTISLIQDSAIAKKLLTAAEESKDPAATLLSYAEDSDSVKDAIDLEDVAYADHRPVAGRPVPTNYVENDKYCVRVIGTKDSPDLSLVYQRKQTVSEIRKELIKDEYILPFYDEKVYRMGIAEIEDKIYKKIADGELDFVTRTENQSYEVTYNNLHRCFIVTPKDENNPLWQTELSFPYDFADDIQTNLDNIRSIVEEKEQELSVHPILYTGEVLRHAEKEDLATQRPTVYLAGDLHTPHQIMMVSRSADSMDITLDNGKAVKLADLYVVDKVATKEAFRPEISQQMEDTYAHEPVTFDQNGPEFLPRFREDTDQIILEGESKDGGLLQFTYDYDYSHNFETNWDMAMDKFEKAYVEYADNKKVAESESLKQGIRFIPNGGSGKWSGIPADLAAHLEAPHEKVSGVIVSKFKPTAPKISLPTLSAKVSPIMFTLVYNPDIKQCSIHVAVPDNQKVIDLLNATKNYHPRWIDGTKDYFIEKDTWHDALGALEEITLVESKAEKSETKSEEQTTSRGMHM